MDRLSTKLKLSINRLNIAISSNDDEAVIKDLRLELKNMYTEYTKNHDRLLEDLTGEALQTEFERRELMDRFYLESLDRRDKDKKAHDSDKTDPKRNVNFTKIISRPAIFAGQSDDFFLWHRHLSIYTSHVTTTAEKLLILSEAVSGPAAETIRPFLTSDSEDRFEAAVELLRSRFGNDLNVSENIINKLEGWPVMDGSNPAAVRSFADFLRSVFSTAQKVQGLLGILDSKLLNRRILNKLPSRIRVKWVELTREKKDFPKFEEFLQFVIREVDILNDPMLSEGPFPH